MTDALTGVLVRRLRTGHSWSQQELANRSGVNKAYISEFESGLRQLTDEQCVRLRAALEETNPAYRPTLIQWDGYMRLAFTDESGEVTSLPSVAHIRWIDEEGLSYTEYVGER